MMKNFALNVLPILLLISLVGGFYYVLATNPTSVLSGIKWFVLALFGFVVVKSVIEAVAESLRKSK
jgi:xanthine/uracil permease